jgi:hypothetical protein
MSCVEEPKPEYKFASEEWMKDERGFSLTARLFQDRQ